MVGPKQPKNSGSNGLGFNCSAQWRGLKNGRRTLRRCTTSMPYPLVPISHTSFVFKLPHATRMRKKSYFQFVKFHSVPRPKIIRRGFLHEPYQKDPDGKAIDGGAAGRFGRSFGFPGVAVGTR